mmetsp:Transcript_15896/g.36189  ORF Transcript_15896/g.36189 Transcript_15896/m.36189 type:complete len:218 (-) Transcript_15896:2010-2663(-)
MGRTHQAAWRVDRNARPRGVQPLSVPEGAVHSSRPVWDPWPSSVGAASRAGRPAAGDSPPRADFNVPRRAPRLHGACRRRRRAADPCDPTGEHRGRGRARHGAALRPPAADAAVARGAALRGRERASRLDREPAGGDRVPDGGARVQALRGGRAAIVILGADDGGVLPGGADASVRRHACRLCDCLQLGARHHDHACVQLCVAAADEAFGEGSAEQD